MRLIVTPPLLLIMVMSVLTAAEPTLDCIEEIEMPRYTYVAKRSPGGTVRAIITVGNAGKALRIALDTSDEDLALEVRGTILEDTKFKRSCRGLKVTLVFTFKLEGEPSDDPTVTVHFRSPNHFTLTTQPRKPHYHPAGLLPAAPVPVQRRQLE